MAAFGMAQKVGTLMRFNNFDFPGVSRCSEPLHIRSGSDCDNRYWISHSFSPSWGSPRPSRPPLPVLSPLAPSVAVLDIRTQEVEDGRCSETKRGRVSLLRVWVQPSVLGWLEFTAARSTLDSTLLLTLYLFIISSRSRNFFFFFFLREIVCPNAQHRCRE